MTRISGAPLTRRLDALYRFERSGMRLGLQGIERLLELGGRPDRAFPSVLIAGTNGKGSTAAHLASILRAAGLKVGLYTSPHLVRFHERIRVDGSEIGDAALEEVLERWWPRFEAEGPSFFEAATALAFDHFARERVEMAVVEVGLGGRLDATNVLVPRASVITTISTDHAEILGPTLRRIALEKAGIIKPEGTLVLGVRRAEPRAAILEVAARQNARVLLMGRDGRYAARGVSEQGTDVWIRTPSQTGVVRTPLLGAHQARNAALAALAAEVALEGRPAPEIAGAITRGIESTRWPARAEILNPPAVAERRIEGHAGRGNGGLRGDPPVLVDVAHNVEGARALADTVEALFPRRKITVVAAFSRDKSHEAILAALARVASRFLLTEFGGERSTPAATLVEAAPARHLTCEAIPDPDQAVRRAMEVARREKGVVVVTGSFYLMPQALAALRYEVPRAL